ncbi:EmrB/QacA subfamily drug resistance transporter [Kribbella steppae]|uniref:EmrB/QacA subfamily drug resistance transporter n=1 Tax=Kribbella steppae TaxID=2512223 RepID=A0A4V2RYE4_9ACTN|nr:MFS transporter [Kribbella steppae]TCO19717.1 EmrB/QacA subfamily drug resistance transporter [Kribbella steppae]
MIKAPGATAIITAGHPMRWRTLAVSQLAAFMALLDVSIVNVALPSIERGLGVSAGAVQWVVSGYALALGLALVPAGRLGDLLGRRRMFLIALSAFVVTSALTGAAPTIGLLIAFRLLQGVAGGMLLPQNSGLIQELFQGAERGKAFGVLGATIGLATATGPVVGGLIITGIAGPDAWRWVFYVNVPIGLVTLALAARLVPRNVGIGRRTAHLDLIGALLLGGGVLCLLLPAVDAETRGLGMDWWLLVVAVSLLAAFSWWELRAVRRGREPLLDPRLAQTSGFAAGAIIGSVYFIGFTGIWLVLALFYQDGLGYSPLQSGLAVTPFAIGAAVSAAIAGRLVSRFGRALTVIGLTATVAGLVTAALLLRNMGSQDAALAVAGPLLVAGLGGGMVTSSNVTLSLRNVPVAMAGAAGGALQTAQRIGAAIGSAVLATIFYRVLTASAHDYPVAVSDALLSASILMVIALLMAITDLIRHRAGLEALRRDQ